MDVVRRTFLRTILCTPCSGSSLWGHWWGKRRSKAKVGVSGTRTIVRYRRHCGVRGLIAGDQTGVPSRKGILRTIAAVHHPRNQAVVDSHTCYVALENPRPAYDVDQILGGDWRT